MIAKRNKYIGYFCLLACFLFAFAVTADPLLHSHADDHSYQVECQFCKNEISGPLSSNLADSVDYLANVYQFEISENAISITTSSFSPRAPPKI
jgi:hypothetical protein